MILVILGSYCFTAFIHEPSHRSRALRETGRTSTMLRWNSVLMDIPAIRLFPSATVNMETNMVLRVSENGGLYSTQKKSYFHGIFHIHPNSYRNTFHGAYMNMTINRFLGNPWEAYFQTNPPSSASAKRAKHPVKRKATGHWFPQRWLSQRPLKWVQYANIFRKSVRKTSYVSWFCLLNRVICSCSFTLSPSNDRLNGCIIEMTWNPPQFQPFQLPLGHFTSFLFHAFAMSHVKSHPGPPQEVCHIVISYLNLSLFQPYFQVESHECFTPLSQWLSSRESTRHCALPEKNTGVSELTFKTF